MTAVCCSQRRRPAVIDRRYRFRQRRDALRFDRGDFRDAVRLQRSRYRRLQQADAAVPIDDIEKATGINFMPLLNEPNSLEQTVDRRWLN